MTKRAANILTPALLFLPALLFGQEPDAETILRAYQYTFTEKMLSVNQIDGDWVIQGGGRSFAWANGRIMPLAQKDRWESYRPYLFEVYPYFIPDIKYYTRGQIERIIRMISEEESYEDLDYNNGFRFMLYGGPERTALERLLKRISFLGHTITVHQDIADALARIDRHIKEESGENTELKAFLDTIASIGGYNWREIRGSSQMSYHSWGLALDIQPKNLGGKAIYWRWERNRNPAWMFIPPESHWKPPAELVRAFEAEGFVWGGKWIFFDNMHFEYRPELHEINRLLAARRGDTRISSSAETRHIHHIFPQLTARKLDFPDGPLNKAKELWRAIPLWR